MSVLLRVEKVRPVQIDAILPRIGSALKNLLGLASEPKLVATKIYSPDEALSESRHIIPGSTDIGIRIDGEFAAVSVFSREGVDYVVISPDCWRTELESALAAAVAIALAEYSETEISDSALAYTRTFSQTANTFAESIKVAKPFDSIGEAAVAFLAGLPGMSLVLRVLADSHTSANTVRSGLTWKRPGNIVKSSGWETHLGRSSQPPSSETLGGEQ